MFGRFANRVRRFHPRKSASVFRPIRLNEATPMEKPLPENSRRQFLGNLGAALAALSIPAALSAADAAQAEAKALPRKKITDPYIYKFAIGKFEAWSISDGYGTFKN